MIPGIGDIATGGGGIDLGGGGPSGASGTAGGGSTGNRSFVFNNAGGTSGLTTQQMLIGGALALGAIYLWTRK